MLQLLPHRLRLQTLEPGRAHEAAGVHEARELVAGEERLLERRVARQAEVVRVREHRLDDLLGVALLAQDRRAVLGVLVERRVYLVVEVVQERRHPPQLLVLAEAARVRRGGRLDRERVAQQRLAGGVAGQRLPGVGTALRHPGASIVLPVSSTIARPVAESFVIEGGRPLRGTVRASGNKNAALPILAGCLLTDEPVHLSNMPRIRDVETMMALLRSLGTEADWTGDNEVRVHAQDVASEVDERLASRIRASFLLAGPLLARNARASVPPPGGDVIGRRRLDPHIHAFAELGATIEVGERYELSGALRGTHIHLDEPSVMGTENTIMAAALTPGETVISNAASEPHVQDLCRFLVALGARIDGIGSNVLHVNGVDRLHGGDHSIAPEHIEVGSFIGMAAVTGGDV